MIAKANDLQKFHKIVTELIMLSRHYIEKHPEFIYSLMADHRNMIAEFSLFSPENILADEQAEASTVNN